MSEQQAGRQDFVHGPKLDSLMATATSSTWAERLFMNLLSYSIVLIPIAFIVIATKFKLFPRSIQSNALIQWFVYGTTEIREPTKESKATIGEAGDASESLLSGKDNSSDRLDIKRSDSNKDDRSGSTLEFLSCLIGLQVSYLIWGLLQEKIMTTNYPITTTPSNLQQTKFIDLNGISNQLHQYNTSEHDIAIATVNFHDSQFLVFINRLVAFFMAILALLFTRRRQLKIYSNRYSIEGISASLLVAKTKSTNKPSAPWYKYIYCSLSNILSSWCQYEALKYINFPTQCLSKSCKVIPVMLMSKILMNKRYPYMDYFCAILLALGMFVFMSNQPIDKYSHRGPDAKTMHQSESHNDKHGSNREDSLASQSSGSLTLSGLIILALYLTFDSFTSNWQQSLYSRYDISNWQMMAAINFYSIILTLTSLCQLGNLLPAFNLLVSSSNLMRDCLIMSIMSSIGQMFVYYTIKRFGSVIFAVIMTLRQFFSILLSCTIYKHQLNFGSGLGLILVFMVVAFQVWYKSKRNSSSGGKQKLHLVETARRMETFGGKLNGNSFTKNNDNMLQRPLGSVVNFK